MTSITFPILSIFLLIFSLTMVVCAIKTSKTISIVFIVLAGLCQVALVAYNVYEGIDLLTTVTLTAIIDIIVSILIERFEKQTTKTNGANYDEAVSDNPSSALPSGTVTDNNDCNNDIEEDNKKGGNDNAI